MPHLRRLNAPLTCYDRAKRTTRPAGVADMVQRGLVPVDPSGLVVDCCRRRDTAAAPGVVLAGDLMRGGVYRSRYDRVAPGTVPDNYRVSFAGSHVEATLSTQHEKE